MQRQLEKDIRRAYFGLASTLAEVMIDAIKLGYARNLSFIPKRLFLEASSVAKGLALIGSVVGVIDGAMTLFKSLQSARLGNSGADGMIIASTLSLLSGTLGLLGVVGVTIPFAGQLAFIFGLLGMGLMLLFKDDSDSWSEREK